MLTRRRLLAMRLLGGGGVAPPAFVGAYDAIANLVHVYEPARRTLSAYTGNLLRLRRDSDDAEADFGYVEATGELDTAAIAVWLGGSAGYVVTVYDQAGGDNITQATAGAQPLYAASAQNGHAGMTFDGGDWLLGAFTNGGALSQPFTVYAAATQDVAAVDTGNRMLLDGEATQRMALMQQNKAGPDVWQIYAGSALFGAASTSDPSLWSALFNGASSQFWNNDISWAAGNAGANNAPSITVGADVSQSLLWDGDIMMVAIADPSHDDTQRGAMQTALNAYWSIY